MRRLRASGAARIAGSNNVAAKTAKAKIFESALITQTDGQKPV